MLKSTKKINLAFSSIEALIATSVLVVGLLAIISLFPFILRLNKQAEFYSMASALARAKIEQLAIVPYDQLTPGIIEPRARLDPNPGDPFYIFERQSTITLIDGNLANSQTDVGLKKMETIVFWPDRGGQEASLNITSIKAQK